MDKLESAALDGSLFNPHRSPSPARSLSPDHGTTDDELASDLSRPSSPSRISRSAPPTHPSTGYTAPPNRAGGAQTGPKGVITDQKNQRLADRLAFATARMEVVEMQQKRAITGATSQREDELRERERLLKESMEDDALARERWRSLRRAEMEREREGGYVGGRGEDWEGEQGAGAGGRGRGGLREVGMEGFLSAVDRPGWAVILIYEPNVPRCNALLASTLALALRLPGDSALTLLRARATSLGFSLLPPDDPDDMDEEPRADEDVLPTLLAYKNGELVKTWIRVDWEVKEDGVEGLLKREGILSDKRMLGQGRDDEDDE